MENISKLTLVLLFLFLLSNLVNAQDDIICSGAGTSTANKTYFYDGNNLNGKNSYSNGMNAIYWDGSQWIIGLYFSDTYYTNSDNGELPPATGWITEAAGTSPAPTLSGGVLPVELTLFTATLTSSATGEQAVVLKWETATEANNYGFEIERSLLTDQWEKIGFVQGYGNSNSPKEYSFRDKLNGGSLFKYRLKQIDIDGKYEYSPEVEVNLNEPIDFSVKQNYPNPFNPTTTIEFSIPNDSNVEIKVFNVLGMEVATLLNENTQAGTHSVEFNASNLTSGIYFYKVASGNYSDIKKMIILR